MSSGTAPIFGVTKIDQAAATRKIALTPEHLDELERHYVALPQVGLSNETRNQMPTAELAKLIAIAS